jgi:glycerophosphoryl diester phosphodiesterase
LALLRAAELIGADIVEADLHLFRGAVEVRHLKTLGPVPVLWDRWKLTGAWAPRLQLQALLASTRPGTELMLDLKGRRAGLSMKVIEALDAHPGRRITICSRSWRLLQPFEELADVRVVHSVGTGRQLRALLDLGRHRRFQGVSIHERLLTPATIGELRTVADLVMSWPANAPGTIRDLMAMGVDALITDKPELVHELLPGPTTTMAL